MDEQRHSEIQMEPVRRQGVQKNMLIPLAIVIAGALVAASLLYVNRATISAAHNQNNPQGGDQAQATADIRAIDSNDHILGKPDAPVVIVEYSDLECPYCKEFHQTLRQIMNEYGSKGQVAWVYRQFPIAQLHPKAENEAIASECAAALGGNDAFWKFIDKVFEITPSNNGLDPAQLPIIAGQIGIDVSSFNACLKSGKYKDRVTADFNDAIKNGGQGTPFSVIIAGGQKTPVSGAYPYPAMKSIVETVLSKVGSN